MKKFTYLKSTLATLALAFLGACSSSQYSFAPNTGSYHETIARKPAEKPADAAYASASETTVAEATNSQTEASAALAQALTAKKTASAENATATSASKTDTKAAKANLKQIRQELKALKKKVKDSAETKSSVNKTAIVLIIIGLILALLGGGSIIGVLGVIFIVIGLILILLDIL